MTLENLKEIAAQLRTPNGENGIAMGKSMNEKNISMTMSAINCLPITSNQNILELGHGNGGHIKHIIDKAANVRYTGLEISEEMKKQATRMNRLYLPHDIVGFKLYNGLEIPFRDQLFDHIFSVNTLYFWEDARTLLGEIYRVLKIGGTCCITFADKSFMQKLPFTQFGFQLYDLEKFKTLINKSDFTIEKIDKQSDKVMSKIGTLVLRHYYTVLLTKKI